MDFSNVAHAMLLGKGKPFEVATYTPEPVADDTLEQDLSESVSDEGKGKRPKAKRTAKPKDPPPNGPLGTPEWRDWRRGDAQAAREAIAARGAIALLPKDQRFLEQAVTRLRGELALYGYEFDGESEAGIEWSEFAADGSEVSCRGLIDHWRPKQCAILDLKMMHSAHTESCRRHIVAYGGDIQAAAYISAVERIHPELAGRVSFTFLCCELSTGVVTPVLFGGSMKVLGGARWKRAVDTWAVCLATDTWPAYVDAPVVLDAPEWAIKQEMMNLYGHEPESVGVDERDFGR